MYKVRSDNCHVDNRIGNRQEVQCSLFRLIGKASTKTGDKPGVTRGKQWLRIKGDAELLDTPGILPPKFEDQTVAVKLAYTGAIKDEITKPRFLPIFSNTSYP